MICRLNQINFAKRKKQKSKIIFNFAELYVKQTKVIMKRANYLLLVLGVIMLITTSCSVLYREVILRTNDNSWDRHFPYTRHSYRMNSDSICIKITSSTAATAIGPPFIPIFPKFLFFWTYEVDRLEIDVFFEINKPYIVNFETIRFVNKNKNLSPFKIEYITKDNDNKTISVDYQDIPFLDDKNIFKAEGCSHFRLYFKERVKKVKQLDVYIDSLKINDEIIALPPLKLMQKRNYQYNPLIIGS